jgi:hypothetical protein
MSLLKTLAKLENERNDEITVINTVPFKRIRWNCNQHDLNSLLEEQILVLCVSLGVLLELLVLGQRHVRGQHHQRLGLAVSELGGSAPLPPGPLLVKEQLEVVVGKGRGGESPGTVETGSVYGRARSKSAHCPTDKLQDFS